ncbi:MAG: hypothetical protein HC805_08780, partial [Alkalinema sp. RL_2_19]|nr:hypothetical protein [Alkalinema sp. RL_2_19]
DIAPDNLMCDRHTGKPILVDFGSVKQVTETALRLVGSPNHATQIHKPGYTPLEQIKGEVHPSSDLYALAVTVLVLMTGKAPLDFFNAQTNEWNWRPFIQLNSRFENILHRMLARHPGDRYSTAADVLQAIGDLDLGPTSPIPQTVISVLPPTLPPEMAPTQVESLVSIRRHCPPVATPGRAAPCGYARIFSREDSGGGSSLESAAADSVAAPQSGKAACEFGLCGP